MICILHPYTCQPTHFIGRNSMTKNSTFRKTKLSTLSNTFKKLLRKQLEQNNSIISYKKFMQFPMECGPTNRKHNYEN